MGNPVWYLNGGNVIFGAASIATCAYQLFPSSGFDI
jgi:hypothetical protein